MFVKTYPIQNQQDVHLLREELMANNGFQDRALPRALAPDDDNAWQRQAFTLPDAQ